MKKLLAVLFIVFMLHQAQAQEPTRFKHSALQFEGSTLIPLREVSEWLGAVVEWQAPNIIITRVDRRIVLSVGNKTAVVNDQKTSLPLAPRIIKGITYVPLRFVGEALGAAVEYQEYSGEVYIHKDQQTAYVQVELGNPPRWWPRKVRPTLANYRHITVEGCTGMSSGQCKYKGQCQGRPPDVE